MKINSPSSLLLPLCAWWKVIPSLSLPPLFLPSDGHESFHLILLIIHFLSSLPLILQTNLVSRITSPELQFDLGPQYHFSLFFFCSFSKVFWIPLIWATPTRLTLVNWPNKLSTWFSSTSPQIQTSTHLLLGSFSLKVLAISFPIPNTTEILNHFLIVITTKDLFFNSLEQGFQWTDESSPPIWKDGLSWDFRFSGKEFGSLRWKPRKGFIKTSLDGNLLGCWGSSSWLVAIKVFFSYQGGQFSSSYIAWFLVIVWVWSTLLLYQLTEFDQAIWESFSSSTLFLPRVSPRRVCWGILLKLPRRTYFSMKHPFYFQSVLSSKHDVSVQ